MGNSPHNETDILFDFDFYRYNGKGHVPSMVPAAEEANFIRSRHSIEEPLVEVAIQRISSWARAKGVSISPKKPFPSNEPGKYWLEVRFGGLTL